LLYTKKKKPNFSFLKHRPTVGHSDNEIVSPFLQHSIDLEQCYTLSRRPHGQDSFLHIIV